MHIVGIVIVPLLYVSVLSVAQAQTACVSDGQVDGKAFTSNQKKSITVNIWYPKPDGNHFRTIYFVHIYPSGSQKGCVTMEGGTIYDDIYGLLKSNNPTSVLSAWCRIQGNFAVQKGPIYNPDKGNICQ